MPPRTGPRRKKRIKQAAPAPRYFAVVLSNYGPVPVERGGEFAVTIAHRIELDDGNLVLRDEFDAIFRIFASGDWREIRPATMAEMVDMTLPAKVTRDAPPDEPDENREQATLANDRDPVIPPEEPDLSRRSDLPSRSAAEAGAEADARLGAPERSDLPSRSEAEAGGGFVPSSPEEAQRILMEMNRRREDTDAPPPPPPAAPRPKE